MTSMRYVLSFLVYILAPSSFSIKILPLHIPLPALQYQPHHRDERQYTPAHISVSISPSTLSQCSSISSHRRAKRFLLPQVRKWWNERKKRKQQEQQGHQQQQQQQGSYQQHQQQQQPYARQSDSILTCLMQPSRQSSLASLL